MFSNIVVDQKLVDKQTEYLRNYLQLYENYLRLRLNFLTTCDKPLNLI